MVIPTHIGQTAPSPKGSFNLGLQPAPAWIAILGLVFFTTLGILGGLGILKLAFPVAAFLVGVFLYQRYPILYMGFTWWIFFITPLIRRLIDFRCGFSDQSLILMTPFLVLLATFPHFFKYLLKSYPYRQDSLPFVLAFIGIFYSFLVGLVSFLSEGANIFLVTRTSVIANFIQWIAPVSFGFFIYSHWRNYPSFRQNIQHNFFWGGLVMGGYGLVQFLMMPPWDVAWRQEVLKLGFGNVQDQIWSTLNSPAHFATAMIACLLLLFSSKQPLRIPVTVVGCLGVLLAQVRTCWGALIIGFITLVGYLQSRLQMRIIITVLVIVLSVVPLATMEPFSELVTARVQSLSNIQGDNSFQARQVLYERTFEQALINPIGYGMSSLNLADSGILVVLYEMGWIGVIPFLSGFILLFLNIFNNSMDRVDPFIVAARSISVGMFIMLPNSNMLTALGGVLFWGFSGIVMAAHQYYHHQLTKN